MSSSGDSVPRVVPYDQVPDAVERHHRFVRLARAALVDDRDDITDHVALLIQAHRCQLGIVVSTDP
jgi:hypothetical protein